MATVPLADGQTRISQQRRNLVYLSPPFPKWRQASMSTFPLLSVEHRSRYCEALIPQWITTVSLDSKVNSRSSGMRPQSSVLIPQWCNACPPLCSLSPQREDVERGPTAAFCHVSIIQSDVWVICFSTLITSHINSYHQDVRHPTSWASEEISIWICNRVSFKLHHMHGQKPGDN